MLKLKIQKTKIMASSPITSWQIDEETVADFIFLGSKITADGDYSHEIQRLFGRKVMTNLNSILKSRDITLPTKVRLVKPIIFPVVIYGYESWSIKKAEHWRIYAFELWFWRRLLRVPWIASRSNQSRMLKEISPGCSLAGLILKLKVQYLATWAKSWCIGKDPDVGKDWRQEKEGMTEDEVVGWCQRLNGHGFGHTPGSSDGQGGLACCSSWSHRESDMAERLSWTYLNWRPGQFIFQCAMFLCFHTVHRVLKARILKWFAIPFSSGPCDKMWTNIHSILKSRPYFVDKVLSGQSYGFSSSLVWIWKLDYKESWAPKNWCFWTVLLEKTLESPLDCKIKQVNPITNQSKYSLEGLILKLKLQ